MFIRGADTGQSAWQATRRSGEGFAFGLHRGLHEAQVAPNAERAVELFVALLEHVGPFGRCVIDDWRTARGWAGEDLATGDVRDAVARARPVLSTHAGVEISVMAGGEQITLTANLMIHVFAPTDRWLYLLHGKGLRRVPRLRRRSWLLARGEFMAASTAQETLAHLVERLQLPARTASP
jgi:hypothetical protein